MVKSRISILLLGQGGKSAVAEATAVKVDMAHRTLEICLRSMPSSFKVNGTLQMFAKLVFVNYSVYFHRNCYFEPIHRLPHHPPSKFDRPPRAGTGAGAGSSGS
jgi:hypothetical protein